MNKSKTNLVPPQLRLDLCRQIRPYPVLAGFTKPESGTAYFVQCELQLIDWLLNFSRIFSA